MFAGGANRDPQKDADSPESYEAGAYYKTNSETENFSKEEAPRLLLFPMDHRTVADCDNETSYRYEGNDGGESWTTPWIAGLYVLAKQADENITPETFWKLASAEENSDECRNNDTGTFVGRIVNPKKLIHAIEEQKTINN